MNDLHVGRSWPGSFPIIEMRCPCPKAACGLVLSSQVQDCDEHRAPHIMRTIHPDQDCTRSRIRWWTAIPKQRRPSGAAA